MCPVLNSLMWCQFAAFSCQCTFLPWARAWPSPSPCTAPGLPLRSQRRQEVISAAVIASHTLLPEVDRVIALAGMKPRDVAGGGGDELGRLAVLQPQHVGRDDRVRRREAGAVQRAVGAEGEVERVRRRVLHGGVQVGRWRLRRRDRQLSDAATAALRRQLPRVVAGRRRVRSRLQHAPVRVDAHSCGNRLFLAH